ncbi:MAG: hypothetical protein WCP57_04305 [Bacteroidota bacterium]
MPKKISVYAILFIALIEGYLGFIYYPKYSYAGSEVAISWDVSGYYMYLPAIFIYKDIKHCSFQDSVLKTYAPTPDFQQAFQHTSGNYVMKYASGQAIVFAPAFFIAHAYCLSQKRYLADGFSLPYQLAIAIWTFLISIIGLFFLRKVLLFYFDEKVAAFTILSIALLTNYPEYAAISGGLSHNSLFTLYAMLIYVSICFYTKPNYFNIICMGLLCGLVTITRPTEIISLIIPLGWGIASMEDAKKRIRFFIDHKIMMLLYVLCFVTVGSIQLIYWKYVSGSFLVYSYQKQGFDWLHTHVFECLFSVKAGWITYSPIFIFAIVGIYFTYKNHRKIFFASLIFAVLFAYLCFSWSEWWYGWSLGQRAMIQSYPIWAIFLSAFYQWLLHQKIFFRRSFFAITVLFTYYSFWLIHQCHHGQLFHGPEMSKAYYWEILGKWSIEKNKLTLLDTKYFYEGTPKNIDTIYKNNFESDTSINARITDTSTLNKVIYLDQSKQVSAIYTINQNNIQSKKIYKLSADIHCVYKEWNTWKMPQFICRFYENGKMVQESFIRVDRLLQDNYTQRIYFYVKKPSKKFTEIQVQFNNKESDKSIEIDNLLIENFDK